MNSWSFIRRYRLPVALSLCVVGLAGSSPSVTTSTGAPVPSGVTLELPPSYVAMSPVSRILDALTLLSTPQTIAFFMAIAVIALAWSLIATGRWLTTLIVLLVAVAAVETAVAFAPRPMARLHAASPETVIVDFHSHTGASHDVRKSIGPEENREWHRSGGFDAAYITDHVKFSGAVEARPLNPRKAGDGTSLLTGVEGRYHKIMSTIMLGLDERDSALLNKRGNLLPGLTAKGKPPVTIVALPNRHLDSLTIGSLDSIPHFVAIELIDAAPRGLGQLDRDESRLRDMATNLRLSLVAASNNHGFGRTVAGWNLLAIPGWRGVSPDSLDTLIQQALRARQLDAVTIVMRTRPRTHDASLPLTLPVVAAQIFGSLTTSERIVWLIWIWGIAALGFLAAAARGASRSG